jgi:septum formation protein
MNQIILASQSPRRSQLLQWAEIDFEIIVQETDEHYPEGMPFEEIAIYIARNKALAVQKIIDDERAILAADTIVICDGQVLGKPMNEADALHMLTLLAGNTHHVITGVVILHNGIEKSFADITTVEFHPLTTDQLKFYIDKYKPYDKAGAYAIQEWIGVTGIKKIVGDFYNVMGLPVSRVVQALSSL